MQKAVQDSIKAGEQLWAQCEILKASSLGLGTADQDAGNLDPTSDQGLDKPDLSSIASLHDIEYLLTATHELKDYSPVSNLSDEPWTWMEAKLSRDASHWEAAYCDELNSLRNMGVYQLVPCSAVPVGQKVCIRRPGFKIKHDKYGNTVWFKVRLVFWGHEQIYGCDYTKTTSPTARMESWWILLHLAAAKGWDTTQIDVKTAFLYGILSEDEIQYMRQPEDFEEKSKEDWVWMLVRGLYGMKQVGRIWNQAVNDNMASWEFKRLAYESCIFHCVTDHGTIIAALHVDDLLSIASSKEENECFKAQMHQVWTISNLGVLCFVVGIAVE